MSDFDLVSLLSSFGMSEEDAIKCDQLIDNTIELHKDLIDGISDDFHDDGNAWER